MDRQTFERSPMTFTEWLKLGIEKGWLEATCLMHRDMELWNDEEREQFNEGYDPCISRYVVPRLRGTLD